MKKEKDQNNESLFYAIEYPETLSDMIDFLKSEQENLVKDGILTKDEYSMLVGIYIDMKPIRQVIKELDPLDSYKTISSYYLNLMATVARHRAIIKIRRAHWKILLEDPVYQQKYKKHLFLIELYKKYYAVLDYRENFIIQRHLGIREFDRPDFQFVIDEINYQPPSLSHFDIGIDTNLARSVIEENHKSYNEGIGKMLKAKAEDDANAVERFLKYCRYRQPLVYTDEKSWEDMIKVIPWDIVDYKFEIIQTRKYDHFRLYLKLPTTNAFDRDKYKYYLCACTNRGYVSNPFDAIDKYAYNANI